MKNQSKPKKKKGFLIWLSIIIVLMMGGAGYFYFFSSEEVQAISYQTGKVKEGNLVISLENTGTITYLSQTDVISNVSGTVSQVFLNENDDILVGDEILSIDATDINYQLQQAYNDLKIARLKLAELLQTTVDKVNEVSIDELTTIKAPIKGVVQYATKEGMNVSTNSRLLTIKDEENIPFLVELFDSEVKKIKAGQKVSITLYDFMDSVNGTIDRISNTPHSNGTSMVYNVWINVKNPGMLKEDIEGRVEIATDNGAIYRDGLFTAVEEVDVYAPLNSKVEQLYVENGEYVEKGANLIKLDQISLANQVETQQQVIENIELKIAQLERDSDRVVVTSPSSGRINQLYVNPNQVINNNSKIASIVSKEMVAKVEIDELDIGKVAIGQEAELFIPAVSDDAIIGEVISIANDGIVKDGITSYEVYIGLKENEKIKSGMTVDVSIISAKAENVLMVPASSIITVKGGQAVRILEGEEIKVKQVEVGLSNDIMTEIVSGIEKSDVIITTLTIPTTAESTSDKSSLLPSSVSIPGISGPGGGGGGGGSGK